MKSRIDEIREDIEGLTKLWDDLTEHTNKTSRIRRDIGERIKNLRIEQTRLIRGEVDNQED